MKRILISITITLLLSSLALHAQEQRFQKLDAFKIGFFTKRLNLSTKEAELFWPAYNEYQDKRTKIQLERRALIREFNQNAANLGNKELTGMGDRLIEGMVKESELSVELHNRLKQILPPEKVIRFYQVDNLYKTQLLNELQNSRQQQQPPVRDIDPDL